MVPVIPWYITLIIVLTSIAVAVALWAVLASAARRADLPLQAQSRFRLATAVVLGGWLGTLLLLAPAPGSLGTRDRFYIEPLIPLFGAGSIVLGLIAIQLSATLRRVLAAASLPALIGVQLYRAIGVVFLILLALGQLPAHFALPAGWGDIVIGLAAPPVAFAVARQHRGAFVVAAAWNVLGLLDLVVAVGMGTGYLAPLLLHGVETRLPPAAAMGAFPMILVPTFVVPLSILLHLVVLGRLWRSVNRHPRSHGLPPEVRLGSM